MEGFYGRQGKMKEELMNQYLTKVERNLKYLTVPEKEDIISEIRSHILETQLNSQEEMVKVLDSLGSPKELAKCYTGKTIANTNKFSTGNFLRTLLYYSLIGIQEFILSILAGALYLSAILTVLGGVVNTFGALLGLDMSSFKFVVGAGEVSPLFSLPISLVFAVLLYLLSKMIWKYIRRKLLKK